jgi:hypothetical protein
LNSAPFPSCKRSKAFVREAEAAHCVSRAAKKCTAAQYSISNITILINSVPFPKYLLGKTLYYISFDS